MLGLLTNRCYISNNNRTKDSKGKVMESFYLSELSKYHFKVHCGGLECTEIPKTTTKKTIIKNRVTEKSTEDSK